jgi:serine phosphatase RsbU (regulator of sigma subunit)/tetratricopeptide (TPR) repeat protein
MARIIVYLLTSILFSLPTANSFAQQTKVDSLFKELELAKYDSTRCSIFLEIGELVENENIDYALGYYQKSLRIAESIGQKKYVRNSIQSIGNAYFMKGEFDSSLTCFQKAIILNNELNDSSGMAACFNIIGVLYIEKGDYALGIEFLFKSLKVFEELGYIDDMAKCYNNIGLVHMDQSNYEKALEFFNKSLEIFNRIGKTQNVSAIYNNIGLIYADQGNYSKAIEYFQKAIRIKEELADKKGMSSTYSNIGLVLKEQGEYAKAINYYNKSLSLCEEMGDKYGIARVFGNISELYILQAEHLLSDQPQFNNQKNNDLKTSLLNKAVEFGSKSYNMGVTIGALKIQCDAATHLQTAFKNLGKYDEAFHYAQIFISVSSLMFNEEKTMALTEIQTKYETGKKQQEIEKQHLTIEKQEIENRKQLIVIYSTICGLVLILLFSIAIFRLLIQKNNANKTLKIQKLQIEEQNKNLQYANEEINTQKEEIESQRDLVIGHKNRIEDQKKKIEDSIRYAQRIQDTMLPNKRQVRELLREHFILFRPKDVVSGDFYWTTSVGNCTIVAVADCTGHGVPGAFMSMLGISFLNEIVRKKEITLPSQILKELRISVIDALKQSVETGTQKDGMDISLVAIDTQTLQCQWAGACNPLWIVRNNSEPPAIEEIKADCMPIGIHFKMGEFTNHTLQLHKGDKIYLLTDGFGDQFGGTHGKKFQAKEIKRIIVETTNLSMSDQGVVLHKALKKWMNPSTESTFDQVDDITILGIKI